MSDLQNAAQPLVAQKAVDKTKVWIVLCGGAAGLFALTILAENTKAVFPAISRANEALAAQRSKRSEPAPDPAAPPSQPVQGSWIEDDASEKQPPDSAEQAVLAGLQAARERSQPSGPDVAAQDAPAQDSPSKSKT